MAPRDRELACFDEPDASWADNGALRDPLMRAR
jgi:hypothetical protein